MIAAVMVGAMTAADGECDPAEGCSEGAADVDRGAVEADGDRGELGHGGEEPVLLGDDGEADSKTERGHRDGARRPGRCG